MSDRYCMCHPHAIKHEDDTHKSLMLFKKWYQYWLPLFEIVVRVEGNLSFVLLSQRFYSLQVSSLSPSLFFSHDLRILPVDLVLTSRGMFRESSISFVHALCCSVCISVLQVFLCESNFVFVFLLPGLPLSVGMPSVNVNITFTWYLVDDVCVFLAEGCLRFRCQILDSAVRLIRHSEPVFSCYLVELWCESW